MVVQERQHLVNWAFSNFNDWFNWPAANPSHSKITTPATAVEKFY